MSSRQSFTKNKRPARQKLKQPLTGHDYDEGNRIRLDQLSANNLEIESIEQGFEQRKIERLLYFGNTKY